MGSSLYTTLVGFLSFYDSQFKPLRAVMPRILCTTQRLGNQPKIWRAGRASGSPPGITYTRLKRPWNPRRAWPCPQDARGPHGAGRRHGALVAAMPAATPVDSSPRRSARTTRSMISTGWGPPDMAMPILRMLCLWCARLEGRTLRRSRPVPAIDLPTAPASPGVGRSLAPPRHARTARRSARRSAVHPDAAGLGR